MDSSTWHTGKQMEMPEEAYKQTVENEVPSSAKFQRILTEAPFLVAGLVGLTTVLGIGAYKWKTRTVPVSVFLTQLRVAAQGTALAFITMGMTYNMYKTFFAKKKE